MRYWDTSTLAKFYVSEPDTSLFEAHLDATGPAVTSTLTRWELFRVAARKEAAGFIAAGTTEAIFARFLADVESAKVTLIPLDQAVEDRFRAVVLKLHRLNPPWLGARWTASTSPRSRWARPMKWSPRTWVCEEQPEHLA